ncbi:hypothetical protein [Microbispora bryophytorum]|uniref:hypothetical protein n=1 Tax=Microbispora bryophytorum TaxID=1460882 RepID=UPI00115799DD|nr:hypothetical protein [Microbispora bryophytorum]MBD3136170.1 hypothetical protein [Microbispora bryophytorum]TQS07908.1 hypothetical protein FLX07_08885 [Microbispora bryophytorum]
MPLLAAVTAFAVAVTSSSVHSASAETAPVPRFSAVDLVDAIAFGQGPAVRYLHPSRQEPFPLDDKLAKVKQLVDQNVAQNGQVAADLAAKLQSGNRVAVTGAVATLAKIAQTAMSKVYGADVVDRAISRTKAQVSASVDAQGNGAAAYQVNTSYQINTNYLYAYAALYGAAAVLIIIVLLLPVAPANGAPVLDNVDNSARLAYEQFIDQIAGNLRAA